MLFDGNDLPWPLRVKRGCAGNAAVPHGVQAALATPGHSSIGRPWAAPIGRELFRAGFCRREKVRLRPRGPTLERAHGSPRQNFPRRRFWRGCVGPVDPVGRVGAVGCPQVHGDRAPATAGPAKRSIGEWVAARHSVDEAQQSREAVVSVPGGNVVSRAAGNLIGAVSSFGTAARPANEIRHALGK